jgi:hypothetical protein
VATPAGGRVFGRPVAKATVPFDELSRAQRRRLLIAALLRSAVTVVLLVVVYYLLPLDRQIDTTFAIEFGIALLLLALATARQVQQILRSQAPRLQAVQAIAVGLPLLVLLFAATYVLIDNDAPQSFTEPINRTDALYFTVTVFSTVGFGDIAARSQLARIIVTVQMIVGLVAVGLVAKVMLGAVQEAMRRRADGDRAAGR